MPNDPTPLTIGEFQRTTDAMRREMATGFARINGRLDRHGETITVHGQQLGRHDERLDSLDACRHLPTTAVVSATATKDGDAAMLSLTISKPMLAIIAAMVAGLQAGVLALAKIVGWLP